MGGVFHLTRQLTRFSPPNMPFIVNDKIRLELSPLGEAIINRPYVSPSFEVSKPRKITHTSAIIIIIIIIKQMAEEIMTTTVLVYSLRYIESPLEIVN